MKRLLLLLSILFAASPAFAEDAELTKARRYFNEAQKYYSEGKYDEAVAAFEKAYEAKPFAQLLYNIAVVHEKAGKAEEAIKNYEAYKNSAKDASDKMLAQKRIDKLKKQIADGQKPAPSTAEVEFQNVVTIATVPAGATVWLDSKKTTPVGITPWTGTIKEKRVVIVEAEGYDPYQWVFEPTDKKILYTRDIVLAKKRAESFLGYLKVGANIPGANVYIDDRNAGAAGKTPFTIQLPPKKYTVWVTKPGYSEHKEEFEIVKAQTVEINAELTGGDVGYLDFSGSGIEKSKIFLDKEVFCERGPCKEPAAQGEHVIRVTRPGYKSYKRKIEVLPKTETRVRVNLAEEPGRGDAVTATILSGLMLGGAGYLYYKSTTFEGTDAGCKAFSFDCKEDKYKAASYGLAGVGTITLGVAIYYWLRDKGAPSTGRIDVRALGSTVSDGALINYNGNF